MDADHCRTNACIGFNRAVTAYILNENGRASPGTTYGSREPLSQEERFYKTGQELNRFLRANRRYWPDICHAVLAIVARDDTREKAYSSLGAFSFDIARRITHKGFDCLGDVDKLVPPSEYRDLTLYYAHLYCIYDRARGCERLEH